MPATAMPSATNVALGNVLPEHRPGDEGDEHGRQVGDQQDGANRGLLHGRGEREPMDRQQHAAQDRDAREDREKGPAVAPAPAHEQHEPERERRQPDPPRDDHRRRQARPADHHRHRSPQDRHRREDDRGALVHAADATGRLHPDFLVFLGSSRPEMSGKSISGCGNERRRKRSRGPAARPIGHKPAESPPSAHWGQGGGHTPSKRIATSASRHWRLVAFVRPPSGTPQDSSGAGSSKSASVTSTLTASAFVTSVASGRITSVRTNAPVGGSKQKRALVAVGRQQVLELAIEPEAVRAFARHGVDRHRSGDIGLEARRARRQPPPHSSLGAPLRHRVSPSGPVEQPTSSPSSRPATDPNWRTSRSGGRCTNSSGLDSLPLPLAGVRSNVATTFQVVSRLIAHASRKATAASRRASEFAAIELSRHTSQAPRAMTRPTAPTVTARATRPGGFGTRGDGTAPAVRSERATLSA